MKLNFYTEIFNNWDYLLGAGILSDVRIQETKDYLSSDKFADVNLEDGRVIDNWMLHKPSGKVFASQEKSHYLYNCLLEGFFTDKEVERLNSDASRVFRGKKDRSGFEKAVKVDIKDYSGPVYVDNGCGYHDGYFDSVDDYLEWVGYENDELQELGEELIQPSYVWACEISPTVYLNLEGALENAIDGAHEDFNIEDLKGLEELRIAVDTFNELNKDIISYCQNTHLAVLINKDLITQYEKI